jgi:hypothetical protein
MLYDKLNFNLIRDIAPVAAISREPHIMVANPSVPASTVPEFIANAKANPGKISMASGGMGTVSHLSGELFKMTTGVNLVHVPLSRIIAALTDPRRTGAGDVRFYGLVNRIHQGRQAARPRGDHRDSFGDAARCPDCRAICAWLRGEHLVRRRRTEGHAGRDRREAQQGDQRRSRRS